MGNFMNSTPSPDVESFVQQQINSAHVVLFIKKSCPYCSTAIDILQSYFGDNFTENDMRVVDIAKRSDCQAIQDCLKSITGARTVPRIFIGKSCIGGCSDLEVLKKSGSLANRLYQK